MKFRVMQNEMPVYPEMRMDMPPMRIMRFGEQAELGLCNIARNKHLWTEIIFPDQTHGYADSLSQVFLFHRVITDQPATKLYKTPGHGVTLSTLRKGSEVQFLNPVVHNGESWIRVQVIKTGMTGYIDPKTKTTYRSEPTVPGEVSYIVRASVFLVICATFFVMSLFSSPIHWAWTVIPGALTLFMVFRVVQSARLIKKLRTKK